MMKVAEEAGPAMMDIVETMGNYGDHEDLIESTSML